LKGHIFPDLTLLTASDDVFETSSMKGRSYLVIVGATWCGGCKENLKLIKPMLSAINEDSLKVLHITVQSKKLDWEKMINTYKLKAWTNVLDTATKPGDKILHQFGISFIPFYLIVDSRGIIQFNAYQEKDVSLIKLKSHLLTMRKESAFIEPPL
jgi:peroxiredoxin